MHPLRRLFGRASRSIRATAGLSIAIALPLSAQVLTESFTGSTAPGWVMGGDEYTPTLTGGTLDPSGEGWLRMTSNSTYLATYAYYDTAFDSANKTIYAEFDYASWNGTGADGITFFLFDGSVTFDAGADGGSMGYAQKTGVDGLAGGYLGISLDDWGNFTNATEGRDGGIGFHPNNVSVRGPGNGETGYEYLAGNTSLPGQLDFPSLTVRPDQSGDDYRHVAVLLTPTNQLSVYLQFGATGSLVEVLTADLSGYTRPETLKLGFTSGTGAATEIHELRNVTATTLAANLWDNGNTTSTWSDNDNWAPNAVPNLSADILFNNTYVTAAQTIDVASTRTVRGLSIDAPFSYTLNGGTLNFEDSNVPGFVGILVTSTNGSASTHTVNSAITLQDDVNFRNNASNTTLTLTGSVDTNGHTVTVDGSSDTVITGILSDTGALVKSDVGTLTLTGNNTYSGGTTLSGGTLAIGHNNALGSGTISLSGGGVIDSTSTHTLGSSNTLTLSGNGGLNDLTVNGTLSQTGGNHTLSLNATTLAGTVSLAENNQTRILTFDVGTSNATVSGVIQDGAGSGADGIVKSGSGTLTLAGTNTYTGETRIDSGILSLGSSDRIGNSSNLSLNGGTLALNGYSEQVNNLNFADGTIDFGTATTTNALLFQDAYGTPSGVLTVNNWVSATDILASQASLTATFLDSVYFSGYGAGATQGSAVTVSGYGSGWLPLSPTTTGWNVWDGENNNRWSTAANWVGNVEPTWGSSARIEFAGTTNVSTELRADRTVNAIRFAANAGSFVLSSNSNGHDLTMSGPNANSVASIIQLSANNQTISAGSSSPGRLILDRNTVVDTIGAGNLTINAELDGAGNLVKQGTGGRLILSGDGNDHTGDIYVDAGIVRATTSNALGGTGGDTFVADGATLEIGTTSGFTIAEAIHFAGTGFSNTGALLNVATSGTTTLSGALTLDGDATLGNSGGTFTLTGGITGSGYTLTTAGTGTINLNHAIATGSGGYIQNATDTVSFGGTTNANTYTGDTLVNAGTLNLNKTAGTAAIAGDLFIGDGSGTDTVTLLAANQIANTSTVTLASSGTLNLSNFSETIAGLQGAAGASISLGSGTLTVDNATTNDYAGTLSGSGSLTKTDVGRLKLSGSSTGYTGITHLNAGIIAAQNNSALGTGTVNVASSANLELVGGITLANNFAINGHGTGSNDGAIENFVGNNTVSGTIALGSASRIQSSAGTLTLNGNLSGAHNLTFGGAGDILVNSVIGTGSGTVTKEGSGTVTLVGNNTFTGALTVSAGTLALGANERLANSISLTVASGGTVDLDGHTETLRTLSGAGAIDFDGGTLVLGSGITSPTSTTFAGSFTGAGTLSLADPDYELLLGSAIVDTDLAITLAGGILDLGGYTHSFGSLVVTADSVLDFGGDSSVTFADFTISAGVTLTIAGWSDTLDYFFVTDGSNLIQGSTPANQIEFTGFTGNDTKWSSYSHEVTPVPEPAHYGAALTALAFIFILWRRQH